MGRASKKSFTLFIVVVFCVTCFTIQVKAEEPDFSNTTYWNNLCTNSSTKLTSAQQKSCAAYINYMQQQNTDLKNQIDEINNNKDNISKNIVTYASQLTTYNNEIADMNDMINDLSSQISDNEALIESKQAEIDQAQRAIDAKENEIEHIKQAIENRMVQSQETMRLNQYMDIVAGAKSFNDLLRIINGIQVITGHDNSQIQELDIAIAELDRLQSQLQEEKEQLQETQDNLQNGMTALDYQQSQLLAKSYEANLIKKEYDTQLADANSQLNKAQSTLASNNSTIDNVTDSMNATAAPDNSSSPSGGTSSEPSGSVGSGGSVAGGSSASEGSSANPYTGGWGNCTWGAWQLVHDSLGISLPRFPGGAGSWASSAAALGYSVGTTPRVNSIGCSSGHVVFVTQVDGDRVYVKEGNYNGDYHEGWVSASKYSSYIYIN